MAMFRMAAIGDAFVDYVADLSTGFDPNAAVELNLESPINEDHDVFSKLDVEIGGAGVQFAIAAKKCGFQNTILIGKVGGTQPKGYDTLGSIIVQYLQQMEVQPYLAIDSDTETGRAIIIYTPFGHRYMISDPSANATFGPADVTSQMVEALKAANVVHVSGYTLLEDRRRLATLELLTAAREGRALVVVDIVPHKIYEHFSFEELCSYLHGLVDLAFIGFPAAHRLLGLGSAGSGIPEGRILKQVGTALRELCPTVAVSISQDDIIVFNERESREYHNSGQQFEPTKRARGHSAKVQAQFLHTYMTSSDWIGDME